MANELQVKNEEIKVLQKDITDTVSNSIKRLEDTGLQLPPNYNAQNALKSAFFKLSETKDKSKNLALEVCSKESIANTLLDMVTQGLSPAKTQCYFIVYDGKLQLNRSYFGTIAVLKRLGNVKDIWANVIFQDDVFDYEISDGRERLVKHDTNFLNRDKPILGAYAVIKTEDGDEILTVMTKKEIDKSWSKTKSGGGVQKEFPQEMAKRTVINRAAKTFINTSDDSDLLIDAINRSTESEYDNEPKDVTETDHVQEEINQNANKEVVNFDDTVILNPQEANRKMREVTDEAEDVTEKTEPEEQKEEVVSRQTAKDTKKGRMF